MQVLALQNLWLEHPPLTSYMALSALQGRLMGSRPTCYHSVGPYHPHFSDEELKFRHSVLPMVVSGLDLHLSEQSRTLTYFCWLH